MGLNMNVYGEGLVEVGKGFENIRELNMNVYGEGLDSEQSIGLSVLKLNMNVYGDALNKPFWHCGDWQCLI